MSNCPVCEATIPIIKAFSTTAKKTYKCPQCQTLLMPVPPKSRWHKFGKSMLLYIMGSFVGILSV